MITVIIIELDLDCEQSPDCQIRMEMNSMKILTSVFVTVARIALIQIGHSGKDWANYHHSQVMVNNNSSLTISQSYDCPPNYISGGSC